MPAETIISIDPALRCTGFAVLRRQERKMACVEFGVIRNPPKVLPSGCLLAIHEKITALIERHQPDAMAVEGVIFVQSYSVAITLGAARGAALLAGSAKGLSIHEYAPTRVKQAVVGRGAAGKPQVAFMVRAILGLTETPPPDAADAIAIGLTHFQAADGARAKKVLLPRI